MGQAGLGGMASRTRTLRRGGRRRQSDEEQSVMALSRVTTASIPSLLYEQTPQWYYTRVVLIIKASMLQDPDKVDLWEPISPTTQWTLLHKWASNAPYIPIQCWRDVLRLSSSFRQRVDAPPNTRLLTVRTDLGHSVVDVFFKTYLDPFPFQPPTLYPRVADNLRQAMEDEELMERALKLLQRSERLRYDRSRVANVEEEQVVDETAPNDRAAEDRSTTEGQIVDFVLRLYELARSVRGEERDSDHRQGLGRWAIPRMVDDIVYLIAGSGADCRNVDVLLKWLGALQQHASKQSGFLAPVPTVTVPLFLSAWCQQLSVHDGKTAPSTVWKEAAKLEQEMSVASKETTVTRTGLAVRNPIQLALVNPTKVIRFDTFLLPLIQHWIQRSNEPLTHASLLMSFDPITKLPPVALAASTCIPDEVVQVFSNRQEAGQKMLRTERKPNDEDDVKRHQEAKQQLELLHLNTIYCLLQSCPQVL